MKSQVIFLSIFTFLFTTFSLFAQKAIEPSTSIVQWEAYKIVGGHTGTIHLKSGTLDYQDNSLTGGEFIIDMSSISVDGEDGGDLKEHLDSPDFFDVSKHSVASFKITKTIPYGKGQYKIVGDITIKDIKKEIKFRAGTSENGNITAKITIDRSDFNIRYGSGSFFDQIGDNIIYDEFDLNITLVTK